METLLANHEERTVTGMLLPYGEVSRPSNLGPIQFDQGTVEIPADPHVLMGNVKHKREDVRAYGLSLDDTPEGVVATFRVANTPEGDSLLAEIANGKLTRLSPEVSHVRRDAKDKTRGVSGRLFGAAFVDEGAFRSATLYAELYPENSTADREEEYVDENGVTWVRTYHSTVETVTEGDTSTQTTVTKITETKKADAPAPDVNPTDTTGDTMTAALATPAQAQVPAVLLASHKPSAEQKPSGVNLYAVADAVAGYFRTRSSAQLEALLQADHSAEDMLFAALTDIKYNSEGAPGVAMAQPQWIGEIWTSRTRVRKYAPLIAQAPLTAFKVKGYRTTTRAAANQTTDWAGNKAAIPASVAPVTEPVEESADRWAGVHDIAREYIDFDSPEFWAAYLRDMGNDYCKWDDKKTLGYLIGGSTAVTHGTVPAGMNTATVMLVDGALQVIASEEATPTFALAGLDRYRELLLQNKDDLIATLTLAMGLEEGQLGPFRILPSADSRLTGKVMVGAKEAATHYELPGAPIRANALDLTKGGTDEAFFGYSKTIVNNSEVLALVSAPSGS